MSSLYRGMYRKIVVPGLSFDEEGQVWAPEASRTSLDPTFVLIPKVLSRPVGRDYNDGAGSVCMTLMPSEAFSLLTAFPFCWPRFFPWSSPVSFLCWVRVCVCVCAYRRCFVAFFRCKSILNDVGV